MLLLLKVTVLLALALAAARLMRLAPASARHRLWSAAFASLLALPLLPAALPALVVPVPSLIDRAPVIPAGQLSLPLLTPSPGAPLFTPGADAQPAPLAETATAPLLPDTPALLAVRAPSTLKMLAAVWIAGALWALSSLALGLWRVRRTVASAVALSDPAWTAALGRASARVGLRRVPRVLVSDRVVTPMAGGVVRPTVFVPSVARAWDAERRDIVLAHEVAHLAGRDPLRQIVTRVALAIYWFHPLAWLAARQAETAREQACDEAVIACGTRPSAYARVLLEFADGLPPASPAFAALPMVQRTLLEKRLMAILDSDARPRTARLFTLPALAVALLALPVAAAQPATGLPTTVVTSTSSALLPTPSDVARDAPATPDTPGTIEPADVPVPVAAGSECQWNDASGTTFRGNMTISGGVVTNRTGRGDTTRIIQQTFGGMEVCMRAEGAGDADIRPSEWPSAASHVVIETRRGNRVRTMVMRGREVSWKVDGVARAVDGEADAWRARVLAVLDPAWQLSSLRGEESSLRGEISSIYGERSSLQGEISSLYGEVSSMRGEISSIIGEESSLRGEISSIYGELSSMQGEVSSARGEISSLNAQRYDASDAERQRMDARIRDQQARIARIDQEIQRFDAAARAAEVERRIAGLDVARKVEELERRIRAFDVDARVRTVQEQIAALDVEGKVAAIERRIAALDADRRARDLEAQLERAVRDLNR